MPQLLILLLFSPFGQTVESIKELGGVSNKLLKQGMKYGKRCQEWTKVDTSL